VSHQKPGFPLEATVEARPNDATLIRITLPGGTKMTTDGPPVKTADIGPLTVMYYPDQFVQILLIEQHKGPHQLRIPIADLPPHAS